MTAPIIVFAYNRPDHLRQTLDALSQNELAKNSDLYIMIDGPRTEAGRDANTKVEKVAHSFEKGFFSEVHIINHEKNRGLANSIMTGVTDILSKERKVIVVEDDSVTSPYFLRFMNEALDRYEEDPKIWSIGGFTVPLALPAGYHKQVIFTQRCSSYAWATWWDRWEKIDWSVSSYHRFRFDYFARKRFNRWGPDKASMLDDQMNGRIDSWAIRFDYEMFLHDQYNVLPSHSLVHQIGFDGSGTHNRTSENDSICNSDISEESLLLPFDFPDLELSEEIRKSVNRLGKIKKRYALKRYLGNWYYSLAKKGKS